MSHRHSPLEESLRSSLRKGAGILVAVSGGVDSMVLLKACLEVRRVRGLTLEVAHIDHRLRKSSARDARIVAKVCKEYGVTLHCLRATKPNPKENIENWGRKLRYGYFSQILKKRKLDWVLTAHTANDAAETLLMKLFSNKELTGIEASDSRRKVLRPFLEFSRQDILRYASEHNLEWCEDETNLDTKFLRNKIRHSILPFLEREFGSGLIESLAARSQSLHEDVRSLRHIAAKVPARKMSQKDADGLLWRAVEARLAAPLKFSLGRRHSLRIVDFLLGKSGEIELPGGRRLRLKR